jgi:hypothetical protein
MNKINCNGLELFAPDSRWFGRTYAELTSGGSGSSTWQELTIQLLNKKARTVQLIKADQHDF